MGVVVVGQVARDLVVRVEGLPDEGGSAPVLELREVLGGKGANQAVGLAQLGQPVAVLGVAGTDGTGHLVLAQAAADRIDVAHVVRRGSTALLLDVVDRPGSRRLLEHVPGEALLTGSDVDTAAVLLARSDTVVLQLQQPSEALLAALTHVGRSARLVLDGGSDDERARAALLGRADVVRADAHESEQLTGIRLRTTDDAHAAADQLLGRGPELVAVAVPEAGDLVAWRGGRVLLPLTGEVLDPTGAGDAFVAGLVAALRTGAAPRAAAHVAAACARSTVGRLGGRPALTPALLRVTGQSANQH